MTDGVGEVIAAQREALVATMLKHNAPDVQTSAEETEQFIRGFVDLVEKAAHGDTSARDTYIEVVIPSIRDAGMPLDVVLDGMVRVSMAMTAVLPEAHHTWAIEFCADYTRRLIEAWTHAE